MASAPVRASNMSLHQQLRSELQDAILAGRYRPGDMLPSERELCQQHSMSRITVVRALNDLARLGLARRVHGRGTEVLRSRIPWHATAMMNLDEMAKSLGQATRIEILGRRDVEASDLPSPLDRELRGRFRRILRLRYAGNLPIMFSSIWYPASFAERHPQHLLDLGLPGGALEQAMDEVIDGNVQRIGAVTADAELAAVLRVPEGSAHLRLIGVVSLAGGQPVQINDSVFNANVVEVKTEMRFQQPRPAAQKRHPAVAEA
ncbi:GntR family transcriptional regulator [Roseomonas elaeocarpi]|uniref:GntR family transcriptional regulator n=1 Tax=Roseomonas elaeocarpi TaxID=907779 RepID=A0ABV6JRT9_9PROT